MKITHYQSRCYNYLIRTNRLITIIFYQGSTVKFQPLLALGLTILAASTQAFGGATLDRIEQRKNWWAC
jgi:polar amino acid transport system substrate-binding protein